MTFTRRQVLGGLAGLAVVGLGAGGARLWLARPQVAQEYDYELIAAPLDLEIVPGFSSPALAYGGQCPGVELRAKQGEWLRVRFTNRLDEPTTIHWHGIRLPIEMDGVPYISQPPVQPGESFIYQFKTQDAGSYWYHPHLMSSEQLGRGLVGPLIIEEREPTEFRHEKVLCLKTWHVDEQGAFTPFSVPRQAAREGTRGRYSTINGKHVPTIDLPAGQIVRVRLLNVDNTVTYRLNLPNGEARIYAIDGHPVEPRGFEGQYWIGPGMRLELALKVPEAGTELSLRDGPVRLATIRSVASAEAPAGDWPKPLPANPVSEPDLVNAEKIGFRFEWVGAMSDTSGKNPYPSFWQINGKAWEGGEEHKHNAPPLAKLKEGQSYIFELRNMAQYQHPIHLHGMAFKVLDSDRREIIPYFTDTYLLGKNETARVALVADNPGLWMFHCHVIDHMETGLMGTIAVGEAWCG
ncbi:TPA: multicopper oxidase family protein [Pseudomonas aeruginosa]|uniref:multicopper oxidase family protein n=1 Tax=Pseudomonas aeruginosa TaxID=287 RepID=UPI00066C0424|nr:multicopper oxidase family protein [Pseudomonas aeruginosa]ELK4902871.1 multicopper oxidase family protein [Pseudomonas aeruginosa]MBG6613734.1 multicopper oxidase family protein [Pseudomonas aeruginosa]MEA0991406.1 multicopper oxidase family protein [Pseudomonas aeruginosa]RMK85088.1 copper oxidase [Pseudomonas aeruginosa]RMK85882.1 copper oxidase [Pseudomonas aeruginosa]